MNNPTETYVAPSDYFYSSNDAKLDALNFLLPYSSFPEDDC
jgi:hypothetical protein